MIAFISDIHGNFPALRAVLAEIDSLGATEIYCAGDVVGYYAQPNECCNALRSRNIRTTLGNHDWYMSGNSICTRSLSVNDCIRYQRTIIDDASLAWLRALPLQHCGSTFRMVHGGWDNPIDEYLEPKQEYFAALDGSIFISGHTHIQMSLNFDSKVYCNPGSVGQPRDHDPRAAYALLVGNEFELRRVEYDVEETAHTMAKAGFEDYYYGSLFTGEPRLHKRTSEAHETTTSGE